MDEPPKKRQFWRISIAVAALLFGASAFAGDAPPDNALENLIAQYKTAPTPKIRAELLSKHGTQKNPFIDALLLLENSANERGIYHIGSFQLPLPKDVFERLNNAESIAALVGFLSSSAASAAETRPAHQPVTSSNQKTNVM